MTRSRHPAFPVLFAAALALAACEVPIVPTDDTPGPATRIEGTIEILVSGGVPRGPAIVTRYDCADPPPPAGSGRPVDFLVVPEQEFRHGSAPFVFPSVPAESCSLLTGFVDRDRDFHYALTVTGQATAGDLWLDAVQVLTGGILYDDWIEPVVGVRLRAEREVLHDRPAFAIRPWQIPVGDDDVVEVMPFMQMGDAPLTTATVFLAIDAVTFVTDMLEVSDPALSVVLGTDEDGDGMPDDDNGDGLPDVDDPQVLLFRLDPDDPTAESDPRVVLPGVVLSLDPTDPTDPATNLVMQAYGAGIPFDGVTQMHVQSLLLAVPGLVVTSTEPLVLTPIESVAAAGVEVVGLYRVMVMNPNGQLWYLPNELAGPALPEQGAAFEVVGPQ